MNDVIIHIYSLISLFYAGNVYKVSVCSHGGRFIRCVVTRYIRNDITLCRTSLNNIYGIFCVRSNVWLVLTFKLDKKKILQKTAITYTVGFKEGDCYVFSLNKIPNRSSGVFIIL